LRAIDNSTRRPQHFSALNRWIVRVALLASAALLSGFDLVEGEKSAQVDQSHFQIFLLGGHSNILGWDEANRDVATSTRAWAYRWWSDKVWNLAQDDGMSITTRGPAYGGYSPSMALLKALNRVPEWQSEVFGVVTPGAESATAQFARLGAEANRYAKGQARYEEMVAAALEVKAHGRLAGLFLHLGFVESEYREIPVENYADDLRLTISDLRTAIGEPDLPVFLLKFEIECNESLVNARAPLMLQRVASVASDADRIAYIDVPLDGPTEYMTIGSQHHFNAIGWKKVMNEAVRVIREKGWLETAPLPPPADAGIYFPGPAPDAGEGEVSQEGCACTTQGQRGSAWALLVLLGLAVLARRETMA
jgi:MYXO-CTERM domain-containing protein